VNELAVDGVNCDIGIFDITELLVESVLDSYFLLLSLLGCALVVYACACLCCKMLCLLSSQSHKNM
jgi:hypothetical protein